MTITQTQIGEPMRILRVEPIQIPTEMPDRVEEPQKIKEPVLVPVRR